MEKSFYSITETAAKLGVTASKLRYWERQGFFKPRRTAGKRRQYTLEDIEEIRAVCFLAEGKEMRLKGVKRELSRNKKTVASTATVISRLQSVRNKLQALRSEFETMEKLLTSSNPPLQTPRC
ncbi:MAG: MerR family transcriptional regulator [Dysgonamonadaceae bacterium]|jgi:DNA-binding transcriptional MerR regulator|nr:MerR family transcriptional regulator [Dysgonamonadaceae bacterium]